MEMFSVLNTHDSFDKNSFTIESAEVHDYSEDYEDDYLDEDYEDDEEHDHDEKWQNESDISNIDVKEKLSIRNPSKKESEFDLNVNIDDSINNRSWLDFTGNDPNDYARHAYFISALFRLYIHFFTLRFILDDDSTVNINSKDYKGFLDEIRFDIEAVTSYKMPKSETPALYSVLYPDRPGSSIKTLVKVKDKNGNLKNLTTYKEVYNAVLLYRGKNEKSNNVALSSKIDDLFADLESVVRVSSNNPFVTLIGGAQTVNLRSIVDMHQMEIKKAQYNDTKRQKLTEKFSRLVGTVHARQAYYLTIPDEVRDENGNELTQKETRQNLGKIYEEWTQSKNILDFIRKKGWEIPAKDISRIKTGNVLLHDSIFVKASENFGQATSYLINAYKEKIDKETSDVNKAKYTTLLHKITDIKKRHNSLKKINKSIFSTNLRYFFRANPNPTPTADYKTVHTWLKENGSEDFYGPDPYTQDVNPTDLTVGSTYKNSHTGFHGRIDEFGNFYTAQVEKDGKIYGGHQIMMPHLSPATKVRMNPKYDYILDRGYVYETMVSTGQTNRPSTFQAFSKSKQQRFQNVAADYFSAVKKDDAGNVTVEETPFRKKWMTFIYKFFNTSHPVNSSTILDLNSLYSKLSVDEYKALTKNAVYAMVCELIYQTSMRVSHNQASSGGYKTFGALTLLREHVSFTLKAAGSQHQVVGAFISFPGKGSKTGGPVTHDHKIGEYSSATDSALTNRYSITDIKDLRVAPSVQGSSDLAIFLCVLYIMWRYQYDFLAKKKSWTEKHSKTEALFSFNWVGKGARLTNLAIPNDKGLGDFRKNHLNMSSTSHDSRRYRGTEIALKFLRQEVSLGDLKNPLLNKNDFDINPITNKPRTLSNKTSLATQYCFEVGNLVAQALGHYTNVKAKSPKLNAITSIKNYVNPIVFAEYFADLGFKNPPPWVNNIMKGYANVI